MGIFYDTIKDKRKDDVKLQECVADTVTGLSGIDTSIDRPGILLGRIQGGKTRAFIGAIAYSFDKGYDVAIVLTKGTKALARQTFSRIKDDFEGFEDDVLLFDIMELPSDLTASELQQKLILIVKKEVNNLNRINTALAQTYREALKDKTILIIDDEADYASVSYRVERSTGDIIPGVISTQIDKLRQQANSTDYLQVTATPYSLYLQPDTGEQITSPIFLPKRPAFTILLPTHSAYIGGKYYFEESDDEESPAHYIYEEVSTDERQILIPGRSTGHAHRAAFRIEDVLTSGRVKMLRRAIMNFIVGASIRRIQEMANGKGREKYAFAIHTDHRKSSHNWQADIVEATVKGLIEEARQNSELYESLVLASYEDLVKSVKAAGLQVPQLDVVKDISTRLLSNGEILVTRVNSEQQTETLLDDKGQLKLRVALNIFIGGQILDRGITIRNLIGFYYGRRPNRFQQDTVLQHARMYGARPKEHLAVTRFYTTRDIYEALRRIHEFDEALREAIERGGADRGVVFIRTDDARKLIPCSPNKILPSRTTTLRPSKRLLPVGFNTKTKIASIVKEIDDLISEHAHAEEILKLDPKPIPLNVARKMLQLISQTLVFDDELEGQIDEIEAGMIYLSNNPMHGSETDAGKVLMLVRRDRNLARMKEGGQEYSNAPDTKAESEAARAKAVNQPVLIMIRQNGEAEGWRGEPFWWPVLVVPKHVNTVVYTTEIPPNEG